ncbi:hypothetical protein F0562_023081 [Nyssa sinensis]|uniref:Protein kinase domain-containing protein n=1 Tax=Nyssa sinensis TaxID=561372 RepID=A0A5J5BGU1_9ASTE|nr:hypothetical protein F0562_023081 [Nyssa sinensis]
MLPPVKEDHMQKFLDKFEELFLKLRRLQGVGWLHGISIISGKICIAMKFYEGSVGDQMAQLKGGKLPLPDALRYGVMLAKGIQELHSLGVLILNLKPSNFLLNEHDQVVLGDFGIPYLLLKIPQPNSDLASRLGTPNYMAPEQWEPEVRGPITLETDTWGFGCSFVEMLTGVPPWFGRSVEEIYYSIVIKQEKPQLPSGLPPAVENVVNGCFEYDLRNRPLMSDILHAFESSRNAVYTDGEWIGLGGRVLPDKPNTIGYSSWFLSKDHFQVGDTVRSRKPRNSCKPQSMDVPEGTIVGLERDTDRDGFVLVRIHGMHNPLRINAKTLERVTFGFAVGLETLWKGNSSQLQMADPYCVGQFVRPKANVSTPRFEWPHKRGGAWATGRICQVLPNGCLVMRFPGRFVFGDKSNSCLADPAEVEVVSFDTCPGVVEKYHHMEDYHWAVRPLVISFGIFTGMKLGFFIGGNLRARLKGKRKQTQDDSNAQDGQTGGSSAWLPPTVANILFRDGVPTATAS